jgi:hypothetical protein
VYCKLFSSIYQGTLRGNSHGLLVFTNLLAHADQYGRVDVHPKAIAEEIGLSIEQVKAALLDLEAPDAESRSPENEGCRIVRMDEHRAWGWQITNYVKYRSIKNEEDRRTQNRIAQEKWRNKNVSKISIDKQTSASVITNNQDKPIQKQKQIQKHKEQNTAPEGVDVQVWHDFQALRARLRAPITPTAMAGILREANKAGISVEQALKTCCERSWRGFKADWLDEHHARANPAAVTVPRKHEIDPELARLDREAKLAKPMPEEVKRRIAEIRHYT